MLLSSQHILDYSYCVMGTNPGTDSSAAVILNKLFPHFFPDVYFDAFSFKRLLFCLFKNSSPHFPSQQIQPALEVGSFV